MEQRPIIIKRIKKAAHAHHGGSWKVAYADFVTAMMAFFLLMWLMGFTTEGERKAISDFFQNPSAIQGKGGSSTSLIDMGKGMDSPRNNQKKPNQETTSISVKDVPEESSAVPVSVTAQDAKMIDAEKDKRRLESLLEELKQAIDASVALKPFKDQMLLDINPEGLRIQIVDKENRPMFDIGSANFQPYTRNILREVSKIIAVVPNHISIAGHTDARAYSNGADFSNWELSSERANACRRELVRGGVGVEKIARVVGLASTALFDKSNPLSPINRRISIIVMSKETEAAMLRKEENAKPVGSDESVAEDILSAAEVEEPIELDALPVVPVSATAPASLSSKVVTLPPPVKILAPVIAKPIIRSNEKRVEPKPSSAPARKVERTTAPPVKTDKVSAAKSKAAPAPTVQLPGLPIIAPVTQTKQKQ